MKTREMLSPPSTTDLSQDKHKRTRAKSPILTKTKQTYLQNLEKKLDELLTVSTNDKKSNNNNMGKQTLAEIAPNSKAHVNFDSYKDGKRQKKLRLCIMYSELKTCKNGDNCKFAHGQKQLDVEYKPSEWVKIFKQTSSQKLRAGGLHTAQGLRTVGLNTTKTNLKEISEYSRLQSPSPRSLYPLPTLYDEKDGQINKIINTKGRTLLIEATVTNDLQTIKSLLRKGANVNQRDWLGNDSLFYAIKNSNPVILETLIKSSQEALNLDEQFTISKFSYLILAAKMGSAKMIEILLKHGAKPNVCDVYNRTALFYCVERNFKIGVDLLLSYSVDVNRIDTYTKTALDYAFDKKLFDILDVLILAGGASADSSKNKLLLLICAQYNLKESVHELLKRGMSPTEVDENVKHFHLSFLTNKGNNMLMVAYESGNFELLEMVIEYSHRAALNQKNKRGDNLVLRAVKDQKESFLRFLLQNPNVDLNSKDENGKTLLMYAAESGDYETVDFILSKGISIDGTDKYGRTALIFACKNDNVLTVETLLKYNLNTQWKDYLGKSAKHYTNNPLIKGLLKHYMIEKNQLSESLIKELDDQNYQYKNIK